MVISHFLWLDRALALKGKRRPLRSTFERFDCWLVPLNVPWRENDIPVIQASNLARVRIAALNAIRAIESRVKERKAADVRPRGKTCSKNTARHATGTIVFLARRLFNRIPRENYENVVWANLSSG